MWVNINLDAPLTLGKLRTLLSTGELSKFPDNTKINMCIDLCRENVIDAEEQPYSPIMSILGDNNEINFYNYI